MKYTETHEWYADGKVGISTYGQQELGVIVHVELPAVGQVVRAGEEVAVLESTKAAVDIYSPVSGTVVRVNKELKTEVDLLNKDPEGRGFLFEILPSQVEEIATLLLDKRAYLERMG